MLTTLPCLRITGRLPEPVLVVLPEQAPEAAARRVEDPDRRVEHDAAAGAAQAEVELVVLVAHERLVEEARELEGLAGGRRRRARCRPRAGSSRRAVSSGCRRTGCPSRPPPRARRPSRPGRDEDPADVVRARLLGDRDAAAQVVGRVAAVAVDADDQVARRLADAGVEAGGRPSAPGCRAPSARRRDARPPLAAARPSRRSSGRRRRAARPRPPKSCAARSATSCSMWRGLVPHRRDDRDPPDRPRARNWSLAAHPTSKSGRSPAFSEEPGGRPPRG